MKAVLAVLVGGLIAVALLWQPALSAVECVNMLTAAPCDFLGVDLWTLPPGWLTTIIDNRWLVPLAAVAPIVVVTLVALGVVRTVLNRTYARAR